VIARVTAIILALALTACARAPAPAPTIAEDHPDFATIYVLARDWHTDIGIPLEPAIGPFTIFRSIFPGAEFLTFGFGERDFVENDDNGFGDKFQALLPGPGILMVTALPSPPPEGFRADERDLTEVIPIRVSQQGYDRLVDFIWQTLQHTPDNRPIKLKDGPFPGRAFYASAAGYWGGYTCNTWTADALDTAGLPIDGNGILFAHQIIDRARAIAAARVGGSVAGE
jgi:hypothetical protein